MLHTEYMNNDWITIGEFGTLSCDQSAVSPPWPHIWSSPFFRTNSRSAWCCRLLGRLKRDVMANQVQIGRDSFSQDRGRQRGPAMAQYFKFMPNAGRWHVLWADCARARIFVDDATSVGSDHSVILGFLAVSQSLPEWYGCSFAFPWFAFPVLLSARFAQSERLKIPDLVDFLKYLTSFQGWDETVVHELSCQVHS
jgi:hypothetical protein